MKVRVFSVGRVTKSNNKIIDRYESNANHESNTLATGPLSKGPLSKVRPSGLQGASECNVTISIINQAVVTLSANIFHRLATSHKST